MSDDEIQESVSIHDDVVVVVRDEDGNDVTEKRRGRPERPEGFGELRRVVAANIRQHRQIRGWSLERVANGLAPYLGQMKAPTISMWEKSREDGAKGFTIEEVYALCRVFEIPLTHLLAPPELLDMEPVEMLPGEESGADLAKLFTTNVDDRGLRAIRFGYCRPETEGEDAVDA